MVDGGGVDVPVGQQAHPVRRARVAHNAVGLPAFEQLGRGPAQFADVHHDDIGRRGRLPGLEAGDGVESLAQARGIGVVVGQAVDPYKSSK